VPSVFAKLNLKDQPDLVVLNAPESFEPELKTLDGCEIRRKISGSRPVSFAMAFVKTQAEIDQAAKALVPRLEGDVILWFAYPKGSSKRYTCDFNRDTARVAGWCRCRRHARRDRSPCFSTAPAASDAPALGDSAMEAAAREHPVRRHHRGGTGSTALKPPCSGI
jgi:hypothetical protein